MYKQLLRRLDCCHDYLLATPKRCRSRTSVCHLTTQIAPNPEEPRVHKRDITDPGFGISNAVPLRENNLGLYWDTNPPSEIQLAFAERFFHARPPFLLFSASKFRTVESTSVSEVAFLGRSNVGKSSLLNALLGRRMCNTSSKPGRTKTMNAFAVGGQNEMGSPGRLVVLDMPGYGHGSHDEWGTEIMKYLTGRKQLRRVFVLIDALRGIKSSDEQLLTLLRQKSVPHQIILSKVDHVLLPSSKFTSMEKIRNYTKELKKVLNDIRHKLETKTKDGPGALGEILACSAEISVDRGKKLGINNVRWAVLRAVGLDGLDKRRAKKVLDPGYTGNLSASGNANSVLKDYRPASGATGRLEIP